MHRNAYYLLCTVKIIRFDEKLYKYFGYLLIDVTDGLLL
jgi:hypothetical protein